MFTAVMMPPVFGAGSGSPERLPAMPAFASSPYRPPYRSSPLSSSPVRASSPPAATSHMPSSQLDTQSSPIPSSSYTAAPPAFGASMASWPATSSAQALPPPQAQPIFSFGSDARSNSSSSSSKAPAFRFASRPARPVPRGQQSREAAQQTRRTLFLRNVRQRADDGNWDRRNLEQELQKLEWWSLEREIRQARETDVRSMLTEQDIEDAADWMASPASSMPSSSIPSFYEHGDDVYAGNHMDTDHARGHDSGMYYHRLASEEDEEALEERMADRLALEEEAEMEALIASVEADSAGDALRGPSTPPQRPASTVYSDDEDYDALFSEMLSGAAKEDTEMGSS